ncbi:hypothetical protein ACJ73_03704 [Blastomyces percursus]|uniref:GED domain-containing protein n=1 Tax=Blastomyces percursus TaxID=1658174 RepID=A0A1J9RAB6_9EURO|nr:hypothetical protein ACJ73_03704 [Blastomyces percursus]
MSLESLDHDALRQLQSEQSQLLDIIDELRSLRLGQLVELPQLVVFHAKGECVPGLQQRRRRKPESDFKVTIEPGASRTNNEESLRFHDFAAEPSSDTPLETVIEEAKKTMGISLNERKFGAFSDDVLKIDICGPDKPGLTLIDLPGLYHAKSKDKSEHLAIITKPDTLPKISDEERIYIELMNNERIKLQLGWHALRNRDYETRDVSDEARERERDFFTEGPWTDIPKNLLDRYIKAAIEQPTSTPTILISNLEKEVSELARKNRVIELPGTSNQLLVGELFRDQCKPWESIAQAYLTKVCQRIRSFTEVLLQHLADEVTYRPLMSTGMNPALEAMSDRAWVKLQELFSYHKRGHPLPFNKRFLEGMGEFRQERLLGVLEQKLLGQPPAQKDEPLFSLKDVWNTTAAEELEVQGDGFAARGIIDLMEVYYNMALTTFIDNVAIMATENCFILPLESILTPLTINAMEEEEINRLAAEPTYVQRNREQLRSDLSKLNAALRIVNITRRILKHPWIFRANLSGTTNGQNQESPAKRAPFASVNDSVPEIVTPARATLGSEEGENPTKPGPRSNIKSNLSTFISPTGSSTLFRSPSSQEPVGSQKPNQPPFGSKCTESIINWPPRSTSSLFGSSRPSRPRTATVSSTSPGGQHIASDHTTTGGFGTSALTGTAQPPGSVSLFAKSDVAPVRQSLTPGENAIFKNPANSPFTFDASASTLFGDSPKLPTLAMESQLFSSSVALNSGKPTSYPAGQPPSTKSALGSRNYQG